jgi:hypothetical protein
MRPAAQMESATSEPREIATGPATGWVEQVVRRYGKTEALRLT